MELGLKTEMTEPISQDTLFMCQACRKRSGDGLFIKVAYANTGGYSPVWEGRLCEHLTATEVVKHLKGN